MVRRAVKMMADMRAVEEQEERMNPLNAVHNSTREGYTGLIRGSGATPSMGLSQVRGGRKRMTKEEVMENEEAKAQGKALAEHLHSLHGSGYAKDFVSGMSMAGGLGTGRYEGEGMLHIKHGGEKMVGRGVLEIKHGGERMVGGQDGRSKRAEVVKRVMKEKGMKMIEASKYVKDNNLY